MARQDVVAYLKLNLDKFPVEDLRQQLAEEGVSPDEFDEALRVARLVTLMPVAPPPRKAPAGLIFLGLGAVVIGGAALLLLKPEAPPEPAPGQAARAEAGESAFVGHYGYVVRLPRDYSAVPGFKDGKKTVEVVHFCKGGTDPTHFLDEGLYGQLGIVRLEAQPSELAGNLNGLEALSRAISARSQARGEKFTLKNLQISSLRGIQINYDVPFPRVEAYILGEKVLYTFLAGQDDEIYRDILMSLRDAHSEM